MPIASPALNGTDGRLLFDIETREGARVIDVASSHLGDVRRGCTMALSTATRAFADGLALRQGSEVVFSAEHVIAIERPPEGYALARSGPEFFA